MSYTRGTCVCHENGKSQREIRTNKRVVTNERVWYVVRVLCRRRTPRVCRDVELAGVFWFRRDFPRGPGDGEVGGFPGGGNSGDDLRDRKSVV